MVANFNPDRTTEIIKALATIPQDWALTPVNGDKRPYKGNWQKQGLNRKEIERELKSGRAKGYGLLTGSFSGGLLAIDADGPAAHELLAKLGKLPETVAFSSGKDGRCQYLLKVDESFWDVIKTVKLNTGVKGENGKDQLLELRWNGCQSVLPPSVHPETGRYQWVKSPDSVKIAECPNWVIEVIMNAEDAPKLAPSLPLSYSPKNNPLDDISLPVPASILLEICLAKSSRELLNGVSSGGRNDAGAALARDLIGTANYLNSIGQNFDGDPHRMLEDFASQCSPPLPSKEVHSILKSAEKSNPTPASTAVGVDNCIRGWYWQNHVKDSRTVSSSKVINHPRFTPPDPAELTEQFATIYNAGLTGHKLTKALQPLGVNLQQTRKNYEEYVEEIEQEEQRADRKADVEKLLKLDKRRLTLENYLHPNLAEPIKKFAFWLGVDAEAILTYLLPVAAGLLNPNSSIIAKECTNFRQPNILYSAVVTPTGGKKSPALDAVKDPLMQLQREEDVRYEQAMQLYEAELQILKSTKGKDKNQDELPQKPKAPREFFVDKVTVEALDKIKGQQPDHGLTLIKDELTGLFSSLNAYKKGKGDDTESFLSGWNGGGVKKNRCDDSKRVSVARDSLSITGGIQPDKIRAQYGDYNDSQGELARFLVYNMSMKPYKIPRDDSRYELGGLLESIYRKIDALPVLKLHFDKQGQTHFDDYYDSKYEQTRLETKPGLRAAMAKITAQAVRLIGILHVLHEVASGSSEVPEIIPFARVKAGCQLAEFYLGQVTLLQGDGDVLNGELTPVLKVLVDKVNERGSLTATEAKKMIWSLRKSTPDKIRQSFSELAAMDLADVKGTGSKLILKSKVLMSDNNHQQQSNLSSARIPDISIPKELRIVDEVMMNHQQSESFTQQSIRGKKHKTVDGVDEISTAEITIQSQKVEPDSGVVDDFIETPPTRINTSTSSTVGAQSHTPQESSTVDEVSTTASTVDENSSTVAQNPLTTVSTAQDFANKIGEGLGYQSPATAKAIDDLMSTAINAGEVTKAAVVEIVGIELYQEFKRLAESVLSSAKPIALCNNLTNPETTEPAEQSEVQNET